MSTVGNPLVGASWGASPMNPSLFGNPANPSQQPAPPPTVTGPPIGQWGNPGNLEDPFSNLKDATRNAGGLNVEQGQLRNELIPMFANQMFSMAGPAGDFFKQLMNLGSPYYQQQQAAGFNQGVQQNQNAAAQAGQQLQAQGYGNTPSGANAAMIGGMNMQGSQNLSNQFLQQLFQNENLQSQGASGLSQLAALFNPQGLFGNVNISGTTQGPSAADSISGLLKGVGSLFGNKGIPTGQ